MWIILLTVLSAPPVGVDGGTVAPVPAAKIDREIWSREQPMVVWRSYAELPVWLRKHIPRRFDFTVEMLASVLPDGEIEQGVRVVRIAPEIADGRMTIDHRLPPPDCHCSGAYRQYPKPPPVKPDPLTVWIIPRSDDHVILRTAQVLCPPCLAP